jgi:hypothetical protein
MRSVRASFLGSALVGALPALLSIAGCSLAPTGLAEGSRCLRSTQCAGGLVCSAAGTCTSDLNGFGQGMVPDVGGDVGMIDAGEMMDVPGLDAPGMDVPVVPMDTPPAPDTPMPVDTGVDAGGMPDTPAEEDTGVPEEDTGVPEEDAPA